MKRIDDISNFNVCFCLEVTTTHDLVEQISLITDCCNSLMLWIPCRHWGVFRIINSTNVADYLRGVAPFIGKCWYRIKTDCLNMVCSQTASHFDFIGLLLHGRWGRIYISPLLDKSTLHNRLCDAPRCCWIYRCSPAPFLFPHLCKKNHWNGSTCNPFKTKTSLAVFLLLHCCTRHLKIFLSLW